MYEVSPENNGKEIPIYHILKAIILICKFFH